MTDAEAADRIEAREETQDPDAWRQALDLASHALRCRGPLVEALEACATYIPGSSVRSWPPGHGLREDAMAKIRAALALAKETP